MRNSVQSTLQQEKIRNFDIFRFLKSSFKCLRAAQGLVSAQKKFFFKICWIPHSTTPGTSKKLHFLQSYTILKICSKKNSIFTRFLRQGDNGVGQRSKTNAKNFYFLGIKTCPSQFFHMPMSANSPILLGQALYLRFIHY